MKPLHVNYCSLYILIYQTVINNKLYLVNSKSKLNILYKCYTICTHRNIQHLQYESLNNFEILIILVL